MRHAIVYIVPGVIVAHCVTAALLMRSGDGFSAIPIASSVVVAAMVGMGLHLYLARLTKKIAETAEASAKTSIEAVKQPDPSHQIISYASDMLASLDRDSRYLAVTKTYAAAFNMKPHELVGKRPDQIFDEDVFTAIVHPNIRKCLAEGTSQYDTWLNFPDKGRRFIHVTYTATRDDGGHIDGLVVAGRDITERKELEDDLHSLSRALSEFSGDTFFEQLTQYLSEALGVRYSFVGTLAGGDSQLVRTIAVSVNGQIQDNFSYSLEGTPCRGVLDEKACIHPSGVVSLFPDDHLLQDMDVDAYAGIPLRDSSGDPIGLLVVMHDSEFQDIARIEPMLEIFAVRASTELERVKSEQRLRESEERFRSIFTEAPESVVLLKIEGDGQATISAVNRAFTNLLGAEQPEIVGKPITHLHHNDHLDFVKEMITAITEGVDAVFETAYFTKDKNLVPVEVTAKLLSLEGQHHILAFVRDITDRQESVERDAMATAVIRNATDGFVTITVEGIIESVNPSVCALFGYDANELLGSDVGMIMPASHAKKYKQYIARYMETRVPHVLGVTTEVRVLHKSGSEIPVSLSVSEILVGGRVLFSGVLHDLSHERELEQQLLQAQKMESLGTLAGGIAHDFNNILQAILGFTKMARETVEGEPDELRDYLDQTNIAAQRAAELVNQILTFSRASDVDRSPMKIQSVIREALSFLRSSIPNTIEIESDISDECGHVNANPTHIHQIVTNLCTNAMHAMEEGGGVFKITLQPYTLNDSLETVSGRLEPGEFLEMQVSDTGTGIAPELSDRLLDPFFTTKETGKGTGLGLATTHGIVTSMNGGQIIESKVDSGTTMRMLFPLAEESEVAKSGEHKVDSGSLRAGGGLHILVVDDEQAIANLTRLTLEKQGYTVDTVNDGPSALAAVRANDVEYDAAIFDYTMPGMTGIELAKKIETSRPGLQIVLATGMLEQSDLDKNKPENIVNIIKKPYTLKVLMEALDLSMAKEEV